MPADLLGPTLEEVQMWLRSASGWVPAGFVLNVEPVNARLGRVLVVEDDPGIATQLVRGLTRAGYETGSVTTGKAALDWPVPDVFLLDLGLPDMDGVEVCRRLRQACDAAIIIVTARREETDRVLALDEGAGAGLDGRRPPGAGARHPHRQRARRAERGRARDRDHDGDHGRGTDLGGR